MPLPQGRIGTAGFTLRTGIGKTTFFQKYRQDRYWIDRLDIRIDATGRLNMDEDAVDAFAAERRGVRPSGVSERAQRALRECPECAEWVQAKARLCRHCQSRIEPAA